MKLIDCTDFHRVEVRADMTTGLRAVFALHDLTLGPAIGGTRHWRYPNERSAVADALRLARGMTYKNALAGLSFGGGKAVVMSQGAPLSPAALRVYGRWIEQLGGEYVTAEDVGMRPADLLHVRKETRFVTGIAAGGDPGVHTARGVHEGIEAALGSGVADVRVAVQGLGSVGMNLVQRLAAGGARLVVADLDPVKVEVARGLGARVAAPDEVLLANVDVVAPCALGGVITAEVAGQLRAKVVAGSANNQLQCDAAGRILRERGVYYAPDYVINAGGIISAAFEYLGKPDAARLIDAIAPRLTAIFAESEYTGDPTHLIADRMARAVLDAGRGPRPMVDALAATAA